MSQNMATSAKQDGNLRGMAVSSISLVTFVIGANIVCLRMYIRVRRHITGWDDYTTCVALVGSHRLSPYRSLVKADKNRHCL